MKKTAILLIFCTLFCLHVQKPITAHAEQTTYEYLRVTTHDTPIYRDKDGRDFLFYLPYSYYVKVLEEYPALLHVECFGGRDTPVIDGYVSKDLLLSETPARLPYLDYTITTCDSIVMYEDPACTKSLRLIFADRSLGYYGSANTEAHVYFVCYMGYTGYVKEDGLTPFQVPIHPDPIIDETQPLPETDDTTKLTADYTGLKTAIIVCLLSAGVIGLFAVVKRKPHGTVASTLCDDD